MIYDAQGADEIICVDIDAADEGRTIVPELIEKMITECRLPVAAGGGIRNVKDAHRCFAAGADKIVVNTHGVLNPALVGELAKEFGTQSVVVSLDVKKDPGGEYRPYVFSGKQRVEADLDVLLKQLIGLGAGEIILTAIDREGRLKGFDVELYHWARSRIDVPLIASGGAGSYDDLAALFHQSDCDGAAVGTMLFLRDYDIVRIKAYLTGKKVAVRDA